MEGPSGLAGAGAGAMSPLSYTGLVLAGANRPETAGSDGGILTGEMILGLDLHRMDLAVLSACQTGLGDGGRRPVRAEPPAHLPRRRLHQCDRLPLERP